MRELPIVGGSIRRHVLSRRSPEGLISLRYLWPWLSDAQRAHRSLVAMAYPGRPRSLAAALHALQWVRWVSFGGWRTVLRAVSARGPKAAETFGVPLSAQRRWALYYALAHTLPPADFYRFHLFLPEQRRVFWDFVYNSETGAFHRWRDRVDSTEARVLLRDKLAFERELTAAGIAATATDRSVPRGSSVSVLDGLDDGHWFCKPHVGAQAAGVFHLRVDGADRSIARLHGADIVGDVGAEIERRFAAADYLVQRAVISHDFVEPIAQRHEATTLRIITEREPGQDALATIRSAVLEVPGAGDGYDIYEIDVEMGRVAVAPVDSSAAWRRSSAAADRGVFGELTVPFWAETVAAARVAHDLVPTVFGVAWDFIISPDGPVLLEGNSGWSTVMPQRIGGPYLAQPE